MFVHDVASHELTECGRRRLAVAHELRRVLANGSHITETRQALVYVLMGQETRQ
jgi:hypothetical protein